MVAIYNEHLTWALPPQIVRLPRNWPLSRLKGANPTKAAIWRRLMRPNSGRLANSEVAVVSPMPGTPCNKSSLARQLGLASSFRRVWWSVSRSRFSNHWIWALMSLRTGGGAPGKRFFSAVNMETNCWWRVTRACNVWVSSSFNSRTSGRTASPKLTKTLASMRSVLASIPLALAKSRTWRGLTTTTGNLLANKALTRPASYRPVASTTIKFGFSDGSEETTWLNPSLSFVVCHTSAADESATSSDALDTSIPTTRKDSICINFNSPALQNAGFEPWQLFGLEENGRNDPSSPTVLAPRIRTAYYVRDIKHYCNIMHDTDHKMASVQTYKDLALNSHRM